MMESVLSVSDVHKTFDAVRAVNGLSFTVGRGEIFALLGPNGAGKSTMVRMLMGILRPDAGTIDYTLNGVTSQRPDKTRLGYLPEERGLYKDLPVVKTLAYMGALRGMDRTKAKTESLKWLERVGLDDRAGDKLDTLSKGNQQKVQFISGILHRPDFAALDEPFSGMDPVNQEFFLEIIRELRGGGMTILLSSHQMQLVERIADRVLLVDHGAEVLAGTIASIRAEAQRPDMTLHDIFVAHVGVDKSSPLEETS